MPAAAEQPENRLARESSPYLLQHARNPVDWRPWGTDAFEEARRRGVPIFLSIGYSTCYWCHVMERESFENEAIARSMNEKFVCIKVDREERPDVDDIYMAAVQLMTRRGGWPMSVWLTPPGARGPDDRGLEPFFAGTYFPAEPRHGMTSFPQLLANIAEAWSKQRDEVIEQAARVADAVRDQLARASDPVPIGTAQVGQAVASLLRIHDSELGGFGGAPKFPQPVYLEFLLRATDSIADPAVQASARRAVRLTLDRMALGGMNDQIGGGFHRYSTDERWLVPHFEKMLYDQGQLASVYARIHQRDRDDFDAAVLRRTLDYVLREMTGPDGAFYSAQDAEVNHREGQNYLWTTRQLREALDEEDAAFASSVFGVDGGPNFRDPHHPEDPASNVLFLPDRPEAVAERMGLSIGVFNERLARVASALLAARDKRDQPGLDDKVLVGWNGLMIAGFADAAAALREKAYLAAARRAADTILASMRDDAGGLLRSRRGGRAHVPAFLDDYSMFMQGLIALHRASITLGDPDEPALQDARALWSEARVRFGEPGRPGVLHDTLASQSDLIVRASSTYDGAIPAAPSVMLNNLIDLYELTGDRATLEDAAAVLARLSHAVAESPIASINSTRGLLRLLAIDPSIVESIGKGSDHAPTVVRVNDAPVRIHAATERVVVTPAAPVNLDLELRIMPGFHVTAHEPGVEGLVPFTITLQGGAGVTMRVGYPPGEPYIGAALPEQERGRMRVYSALVPITLTFERTGEPWSGRPMIVVTYQACDEEACFQPITVELDVALDPG